jgi:FAD binding domain-containing protein/berberine-like enzyme
MESIALESDVDQAALRELDAGFDGNLIAPSDASYDEMRAVWNGSISRRPALIARAASESDASGAIAFARRTSLPLAVRSGGHSFPGLSVCDGGIVLDLRAMNAIQVDPNAQTARVQAGALLGELDRATQAHGLAVPAGIVTHTGLAGLTLGGGIGWLTAKYGLTIDHLLRARLITAAGETVTASAEENTDLFWGIRGGGGNFGVITEFEFRLSPVGPQVLAGPIFWPISKSPDVLRFYRDWVHDAPEGMQTIVVHRKAPPLPFIPAELRGELVVAIVCCYPGPIEDGERAVKPLRDFGAPVLDACEPKPFVDHQAMFDPSFPHGQWYYMRACDVLELTDEVIDTTVEHSLGISSPLTSFPIWNLGGAMGNVSEGETAFHGRQPRFEFNITAATADEDGFDAEREWVRNFWTALEPQHSSVYVNFLMDEGADRVRAAYGDAKYDRLTALKRKYDPDNFFRLNQNIPPD